MDVLDELLFIKEELDCFVLVFAETSVKVLKLVVFVRALPQLLERFL